VYDYLQGDLVDKGATEVTLEVGGVGYRLTIPLSTSARLPARGIVRLFTHLHLREDRLQLFGFHTHEERALFQALLRVNGIGPATALSILSHLSVAEFKKAVGAEDASVLAKVKGIGKKISERVILELKDAFPLGAAQPAALAGSRDAGRVQEDAILALKTLGYTRPGAEAAVRQVWGALDPARPPTVEELVRKALAVG